MKKIISIILFIMIMSPNVSADSSDDIGTMKKFYVTAYYSPLPDQQFYLRGNYEDEVKLNGEGKRGASGKEVYPGMVAAPKNYAFGTKIFFEGIGLATVDDRGGAIVGSGSRGYDADRIDIWMGYGEEGLKRALTWGKRPVYGRIISKNEEDVLPSIALENFKIGEIDFASLKNASLVGKNAATATQVVSKEDLIPATITRTSSPKEIKTAKTVLSQLRFYSGAIDGIYSDKLIDAIYSFQLANRIVMKVSDKGAGTYGPKTKQVLMDSYLTFINAEKVRIEVERQKAVEISKIETQVTQITKSMGLPKENEVGQHVRKLQKTLKVLGYFSTKDTAIYGPKTKESIMKYQISKGLIRVPEDAGAGKIGPKTLSKIKEDLKMLAINDKTIIKSLDS